MAQTSAVVVTAHGGTDVLEVQPVDVAEAGPGQVQVRVAASGVNFVDVYERQGIYPTTPPFVLGKEGAGEVVAVGEGVESVREGDVVAWADQRASHAGLVNAAADRLVPVPPDVPPDVAAAVLLQGMTAHYLVATTYPLQAGDVALVHAAAGGVGQLLVQLARARGATVIGTVSTPQKAQIAQAAGAHEVIRYGDAGGPAELAAEVRRRNGDRGVQVVYDGVGQATFDASLGSLARRGTLVLFGAASGPVAPVDPRRLMRSGSLFLTRPTLGDYIATRDELLWRGGEVLAAIGDGTLRSEISAQYAFAEARAAYDDLESRRTTGKLLLVP